MRKERNDTTFPQGMGQRQGQVLEIPGYKTSAEASERPRAFKQAPTQYYGGVELGKTTLLRKREKVFAWTGPRASQLFVSNSPRGVSKQALCSCQRALDPELPAPSCGNGNAEAASATMQLSQNPSPNTSTQRMGWVSERRDPLRGSVCFSPCC